MSKNLKFRTPFERLSNVDECRLIQVIEVKSVVGEGDGEGSPMRQITEYYSTDGLLLARTDYYINGSLEKGIWTDPKVKESN